MRSRATIVQIKLALWGRFIPPPAPMCSMLHSLPSLAPVRRGARRSDAALPALLLSIQRWWGSRLQEFVCGGGCPVSRYLLTDAVLAAIVRHSPHLHTVR